MGQNLKESQSLGYILKLWFKKTIDFQTHFLKYYQSFQKKSQDGIQSSSIELQKFLGKAKTKQSETLMKQLFNYITGLEIEIIVLQEFLIQYKLHLEKTQDYKVIFPTLNRIKQHVENNIETISSINTLQSNLAKSAAVVFIFGKRSNKKSEAYFDDFVKEYTNLIRRLARENNIFSEEFENIVSLLEKEIEIVVEKEKLKEEENPAK
ncbi:MAG: hypothetical protein KGD59_05385 [Candidatus Heimdallarchaeota archaeon]|nr:hypothetical protein [Candidatus Heimdallarchaeota archaeon]MBY8993963.1 hypothetical protein [Candidatus Heimdallarchaeota archaeon]